MPWLRTQTEFEMEDEDVFPSSPATVSDPRNGQPGAAIPAKFQVTVRRVQHPAMDRMSKPRPIKKIVLTDVSRERR